MRNVSKMCHWFGSVCSRQENWSNATEKRKRRSKIPPSGKTGDKNKHCYVCLGSENHNVTTRLFECRNNFCISRQFLNGTMVLENRPIYWSSKNFFLSRKLWQSCKFGFSEKLWSCRKCWKILVIKKDFSSLEHFGHLENLSRNFGHLENLVI